MLSGNGLYGKQDLYGRLVFNLLRVGKYFMIFLSSKINFFRKILLAILLYTCRKRVGRGSGYK